MGAKGETWTKRGFGEDVTIFGAVIAMRHQAFHLTELGDRS
jgi:hypothetical protein